MKVERKLYCRAARTLYKRHLYEMFSFFVRTAEQTAEYAPLSTIKSENRKIIRLLSKNLQLVFHCGRIQKQSGVK